MQARSPRQFGAEASQRDPARIGPRDELIDQFVIDQIPTQLTRPGRQVRVPRVLIGSHRQLLDDMVEANAALKPGQTLCPPSEWRHQHHKNLNRGDFLVDDRPNRNGADRFEGEVIHFGPDGQFTTWPDVVTCLRARA